MAALFHRKGSDLWYVDFVYRSRRYRKSTETSDRKLAELFLKDIEVKIARDNLGFNELNRKEVPLSKFIEEYLEYSKAEKAEKTLEIDSRALNQFKKVHGDVQLSRVTSKHAEDFKIKRLQNLKPVSVNMELRQLKAAFEKAVRWGHIHSNPFKGVDQCRVKNSNLPKFLTKEEVNILLGTIPEGTFRSFVCFCLYTGCRRGEALNLTWDDIDMEQGKVTFRITKTGKSRIIPFNGILTLILGSMERTEDGPFPFQKSFVTHKFKDYLKAAGIKNYQSLKLHSLRHTFASHLIMSGVDLMTVSKLLGHSTVRTTELYAHLVPDHMRASIERLKF
jgi:integrase